MAKSRLENTFNNVATGLFLRLLTLVLNFASRTLFIYFLGDGCLGLNSLFTTILSMFSLAELGIGQAITYYMYKPVAEDNQDRLSALVSFYRICYRIIGFAIAVIGVALIPFLPKLVNLDVDVPYNITVIYLLFLANTVVTYLFFSYPRTVLTAHQQESVVNKVDSLFVIISVAAEILSLIITKNFIVYLLVRLALLILKNVVLGSIALKRFPYIRKKAERKIERTEIRHMFRDVYAIFIVRLSSQLFNSTDNLFISAMLGTVLAGYNGNYLMIINAIYGIISTVIYSCTASVGNLCATETKPKIEKVFSTMDFINFWIACFCTVCLYQLLNPFITLFWGAKYTFSMFAVALMCAGFYIVASLYALFTFRQAMGLFRYCIYNQFFAALVNIGLNFVLIEWLGLEGLFLATIIANIGFAIFPYAVNIYKVGFEMPWLPYIFKILRGYVICFGCCALTALLCRNISVNATGFILQAAISAIVPNAVICLLFFRTEEFKNAMGYALNILKKFTKKK